MDETPKTTAPQWLLSRDGKRYGPMASGQLKHLCQTGKIGPADLICRAGSDRWTPAGQVRGLFPPNAPTPEVAVDTLIRPVEEATAASGTNADSYWKTIGSVFCIVNLLACGGYGLVKPPPAIVQSMESLKESTRRIREEVESVTKGLGATFVDPTKSPEELMKDSRRRP